MSWLKGGLRKPNMKPSRLITPFIIMSGAISCSPADPYKDIKNRMVGFWKLGEATSATRLDSVNGFNLTDNNAVAQIDGKISKAAHFTAASTQYLTVAHDPALGGGDRSFSMGAWIYLDSLTTDRRVIAKTETTAGVFDYYLSYGVTHNLFVFFMDTGADSPFVEATTFGAPSINTWYLLVAGFDANTRQLYISVNATENRGNPITASQIPFLSAGAFSIGRTNFTTSEFPMDGRIDEAFFMTGILNAKEQSALFNGGTGVALY